MELEDYIQMHPEFESALSPIKIAENAPLIARKMAEASNCTGVGPMASVAGAIAQMSAEAAINEGTEEAIVENGGDIFIFAKEPVEIGIYSNSTPLKDNLALRIMPDETPISICASSGKMGRSFSKGKCDLALVVAQNAFIADAAATFAANLVKTAEDINHALSETLKIRDVSGIMIFQDGMVGMAGRLPSLIKNEKGLKTELITGLIS